MKGCLFGRCKRSQRNCCKPCFLGVTRRLLFLLGPEPPEMTPCRPPSACKNPIPLKSRVCLDKGGERLWHRAIRKGVGWHGSARNHSRNRGFRSLGRGNPNKGKSRSVYADTPCTSRRRTLLSLARPGSRASSWRRSPSRCLSSLRRSCRNRLPIGLLLLESSGHEGALGHLVSSPSM